MLWGGGCVGAVGGRTAGPGGGRMEMNCVDIMVVVLYWFCVCTGLVVTVTTSRSGAVGPFHQ